MARATVLAAALAAALALTGCSSGSGGGTSHASSGASNADLGAPAIQTCLHAATVAGLQQASEVSCAAPHEAQVYALIGLPATVTDPGVKAQVTKALPELACPDVRTWTGYRGSVPVGLLHTWQFPTKAQIRSGARWAACLAILAPGPDHRTLKGTVGSLEGKLAGVASPLPELGRCAPAHTNAAFTPSFCQPGSTQWIWLGAHAKPAVAFPGVKKAKKVANSECRRLAVAHGGGAAFVYYPQTAALWAKGRADWSCWMPVAEVTS